jgi:hypothetical protein
MDKFEIPQSRLEAVCRGAICTRIGPVQRVTVAPVNCKVPTGSWELFNLEPMPAPDALRAVMEVIRDLQNVFVLKVEN